MRQVVLEFRKALVLAGAHLLVVEAHHHAGYQSDHEQGRQAHAHDDRPAQRGGGHDVAEPHGRDGLEAAPKRRPEAGKGFGLPQHEKQAAERKERHVNGENAQGSHLADGLPQQHHGPRLGAVFHAVLLSLSGPSGAL